MSNVNRSLLKDSATWCKVCLEVERYGFFIRVYDKVSKTNRIFSPRTFTGEYGVKLACNLFSKVLRSQDFAPRFKRSFGVVTFHPHF